MWTSSEEYRSKAAACLSVAESFNGYFVGYILGMPRACYRLHSRGGLLMFIAVVASIVISAMLLEAGLEVWH